jgi:hypothetical protein
MIPEPTVKPQPFALDDLNWFETTDRFFQTRAARLASVIEALESIERGEPVRQRVVTTRYASGLPLVTPAARSKLKRFLRGFAAA